MKLGCNSNIKVVKLGIDAAYVAEMKQMISNPERCLCYVLKHIYSMPEDKYYVLLPEFREDEEQ